MAQGKKHKPTEELRKVVENLAIGGVSYEEIANALEISRNTLTKHYSEELERGPQRFKATVIQKLRNKILDEDSASIFFYLKTQAGWRETNRTEITGEGGGPIRLAAVDRPRKESMEEWLERTERERLERKAAELQRAESEAKRLPNPQEDEP